MTNDCKTCPVSTGTHKPAEAVHQISEPDAQHLQELAAYRFTVENLRERVAELESQLAAAPQAVPFMWAIQEPGGSAYMDENCVSTSRGIVEAEVDGLNLGLGADDEPYKVVPVYLAATQPAAQGMDARRSAYATKGAKEVFCKKCEMTVISNCGSASGCPVRNIYAAQAKQGEPQKGDHVWQLDVDNEPDGVFYDPLIHKHRFEAGEIYATREQAQAAAQAKQGGAA